MSFKSILKKIGEEANKFDELIPIWGPLIHAATSTISPTVDDATAKVISGGQDGLARASQIIADVEIAGQAIGLPGIQKAQLAAPAFAQLILDLPAIRGKKPKDPIAFKAHMATLAGALADAYNDFEA